jgi:predicted metallo-beta-lactamase superfamily hydrolase
MRDDRVQDIRDALIKKMQEAEIKLKEAELENKKAQDRLEARRKELEKEQARNK